MRPGRAWRRRLLILATLYFTFVGGTFLTDHRFWLRVVHHVVMTVMVGAWLAARLRRPRLLPATALDAPLAAFFLANVVATIFAVDPRVSLEFLWRLAVHLWLFYAIADLFAGGHGRDVFEALFLASGVVVLIAAFEFLSWYFGISAVLPFQQGWPSIGGLADPIPPRIYRLNFTLGFSTGLSAYLATLIPLGLAFALTGTQRDTRRAFWLWLAGALLAEGLSFSRGGLLSLAVSLPIFAALALWGDADRRASLRRWARDPRVLAVAGILLVGALVLGLGWTRQSLSGHASGDEVRLELWRSAWVIFGQHPLTGVGPYGFGRAFRAVRDPLVTRLIAGDRHLTADNRPLTALAETGLPGGLALAWLAASFLRAGYRRWRAAGGAAQVRLAAACAGVLGFAAHNLVDAFMATPVLLPMLALSAFVTHRPEPSLDSRPVVPGLREAAARAGLAGLVLVSGLGWFLSDRAQFHFELSRRLADRGDLSGALAEAGQAQRMDPALGLYEFQRAYLLGRLAVDEPARLDEAIAAYEAALAAEGTYEQHHANLAALYAQAGQQDAAQSEIEAASALLPREPHYALWAGGFAEAAGDDAAAAWYEAALEGSPEWAESPYWDSTAWRGEFLSGLVARADGSDARLLLAAGEGELALSAARQAASRRPGDPQAQVTLGEVALRVGELDTALAALDAALALDPASAAAYALRAEARWLSDDAAGAEEDARTAVFLDGLGAGRRGHYVLGRLAEAQGDLQAAEARYNASGPLVVLSQGWAIALYGRVAEFRTLPGLEAPGPGRVALEPWLALAELYESQGRDSDARAVYDAIRAFDPYFDG